MQTIDTCPSYNGVAMPCLDTFMLHSFKHRNFSSNGQTNTYNQCILIIDQAKIISGDFKIICVNVNTKSPYIGGSLIIFLLIP